mgnify:CR=1 FL=1
MAKNAEKSIKREKTGSTDRKNFDPKNVSPASGGSGNKVANMYTPAGDVNNPMEGKTSS